MQDPYSAIADVDKSYQEHLGSLLELRGADRQQKEMLAAYLSLFEMSDNTHALEVGCGTGVVSRYLAALKNVQSIIGIDPSPVFIEKAKSLSNNHLKLSLSVGDARQLSFNDNQFDLVVFHTSLCHVPTPDVALNEAHRVLKPGGILAVFDGDYSSVSVSINENDPLQATVENMVDGFVANKWLIRTLPKRLTTIGFNVKDIRCHVYTGISEPTYMLTFVDRGVDLMVDHGLLGKNEASALQGEARRRVEAGEFFGQLNYISIISQKIVE